MAVISADVLETAWQILWPPAVVLFVARVVPETLGKAIFKAVEHRSEAGLARLRDDLGRETSIRVEAYRAEMQASYSTLQTSVDYLAAGHSGTRNEIIEAVKTLWGEMLALKVDFGVAVTFENLFTAEEIRAGLVAPAEPKFLLALGNVRDKSALDQKVFRHTTPDVEAARLFCGDRLWLIFYVFRAVYIRTNLLANRSIESKVYQGWREDALIPSLLSGLLTDAEVTAAREHHQIGLHTALSNLETMFLIEATRVMSGSKAMADSLANVQATLLLQAKTVSQARAAADQA